MIYPGKIVRTVAAPAVRSVNNSRDTQNNIWNEPGQYAICVVFTACLYYKALKIICVIWYGI